MEREQYETKESTPSWKSREQTKRGNKRMLKRRIIRQPGGSIGKGFGMGRGFQRVQETWKRNMWKEKKRKVENTYSNFTGKGIPKGTWRGI